MKIALIGATGFIGSGILAESLNRGHEVTAISTNPAKLRTHAQLTSVQGDVTNTEALASLVKDHDLVISAFKSGQG